MEEIEIYLINLIKNYSNIDCNKDIQNCNLFEDIHLDSLSLINIIIDIESKYKFEFNETDMILDNFASIASIKTLIKKTLEKNNEKRTTYKFKNYI